MSERNQYFHLTLGPVQGFVAQARRTRDFWAGSFLLSWLSSVAMLSVRAQGGKIEFPIPDDAFLKAMQGQASEGEAPHQGSVPNRFKALGARVGEDFDPEAVVKAMQQAWLALCKAVWDKDIAPHLLDEQQLATTRAIWFRQLSQFWEVSWCLTEEPQRSDLLDRRKNWRDQMAADEPGVKCMMMSGWQELSGLERPDRHRLEDFWVPLRQALAQGNSDLREGECLSALAFVKRRFVRHFANWQTTLDNGLTLKGWALNPNVPSLPYMAAAPWYRRVLEKAVEEPAVSEALGDFFDGAEQLVGFPECQTPLTGVREAAARLGLRSEYSGLDGVVFHASQLEQGGRRFNEPGAAAQTLKALQRLRRAACMKEASSFYAVVIMDGDSLGIQMSDPDKQAAISGGLNAFTRGVPAIVTRYDGFLVYAGGDDVLALASVDQAIDMASEIRAHYAACFAQQNHDLGARAQISTSLSAGVQFAHMRLPLTFVLSDAHSLLDEVAKERTGRDALAVRVWKPGGRHLEWSQPWEYLLVEGENRLSALVARFLRRERESAFTHRFFFKAMELLDRLPSNLAKDSDNSTSGLMRTLLEAELRHSGIVLKRGEESRREVVELIEPLLALLAEQHRTILEGERDAHIKPTGRYSPDTLRLVRFLAMESRLEGGKPLGAEKTADREVSA